MSKVFWQGAQRHVVEEATHTVLFGSANRTRQRIVVDGVIEKD